MKTKYKIILAALILIALTTANTAKLNNDAARISTHFEPMYIALEFEDIYTAEQYMEKIITDWKKCEIYWHLVIDHKELEKVETDLVNLTAQVALRQFDEAKTALAQLRFSLLHIPQTESLCIENIL